MLKDELLRLLTELYVRFLTSKSISECDDLLRIDFKNMKFQKDRLYLVIGDIIDEKIVGLSISQWLPCPLAIWNLLFGMAILLNV